MRAFLDFNKGMMRMPLPWRLWLLLLVTFNLVVPLFFLHRLEAQLTLGAGLAGMGLMTALTAWTGFSRLLGLGHVFWLPLLLFLGTRLEAIPADSVFGIWVRGLIVLDAISLVLDLTDVFRYAAGDRGETVAGLSG